MDNYRPEGRRLASMRRGVDCRFRLLAQDRLKGIRIVNVGTRRFCVRSKAAERHHGWVVGHSETDHYQTAVHLDWMSDLAMTPSPGAPGSRVGGPVC